MVDIKTIIDELPINPSEALIQLNSILGNKQIRQFLKKNKKQKDPVYDIHIKSLDGKTKSYQKPSFPSSVYVDYMKSVGNSRKKLPLLNYHPLFKLLETHKFDKEWMRFTYWVRLKENTQKTITKPVFQYYKA